MKSFIVILPVSLLLLLVVNRNAFRRSLLHPLGWKEYRKNILSYGLRFYPRQYLIIHFTSVLLVLIASFVFALPLPYILFLCFVVIIFLPTTLLWQAVFIREERDFFMLTSFLQQTIAVFKSHPKIYAALSECLTLTDGDLKRSIIQWMNDIEAGSPLKESSITFLKKVPHFISGNLVNLMVFVEEYGSTDYAEGLEMIQDDIDDWIEDTYAFKQQQLELRNRIVILSLMALLIAFISKQMLFQTQMMQQVELYQFTMFLFLLSLIITLLVAQRIYCTPWIEKGEELWH